MWPNFSESKSWVKYHGRSPKVQSLDLQNFFLHMYFHIANSSYAFLDSHIQRHKYDTFIVEKTSSLFPI